MRKISFKQWKQKASFHNPLKGGRLDSQSIEIRQDPLTGHQSVYNRDLEGKTAFLLPDTNEDYLRQRAGETEGNCFLCNGRWRESTPRYADKLVRGGRLEKGDAVLFPNLFPLSAYHAIVMIGSRHYRPLNDFPASLLKDALDVSLLFIRRCMEHDTAAKYFTINANYLFPAGASVVHPHLQILGSSRPGTHHRLLMKKCRAYFKRSGSCYWSDLASFERKNTERWLGQLGGSRWITAFSPVGGHEVQAVWPSYSHFLQWRKRDIDGFAQGLSRVLHAYHDLKLSTFNFSCFSGPLNEKRPEFCCMLRLINRQNVVPDYRADDYYFQKLLRYEIILRKPEDLASFIRPYFRNRR